MAVLVEFDKPRTLQFDLAAIKDLEAQCNGDPLGKIVSDLGRMSITALSTALWAGFKHEDRTLSPNLVLKMLQKFLNDKKRLKPLMTAVNDALEESGIFASLEAEEDEAAAGNGQPEPHESSGGRSVHGSVGLKSSDSES